MHRMVFRKLLWEGYLPCVQRQLRIITPNLNGVKAEWRAGPKLGIVFAALAAFLYARHINAIVYVLRHAHLRAHIVIHELHFGLSPVFVYIILSFCA